MQEFETVCRLKEGSRGTVELIRHKSTGTRFVLRRYMGNAEVYKKLIHYDVPNLPAVYEVAQGERENLVLEEYIQGDNLGELLRGGLFTPAETRDIARQLCRALWVLHSMNTVHRDVKPENVILRGKTAVLIDFDAARVYKPGCTQDTQILGTIGFAAPEQFGFSQSDIRTDIYSLGVLINVMLTGRHPSEKLAPGRLGRIVERCIRVNLQRRYPSVLRIMEDL